MISYYKAPISNLIPHCGITLEEVYKAIKTSYIGRTNELRKLFKEQGKKEAEAYKIKHFDYVTFAGTFTRREQKGLLELSGYMAFDLDDVRLLERRKEQLLKDKVLDILLLWVSPKGNGIKFITPFQGGDYKEEYNTVSHYLFDTYGITVDKAPSNISSGCFLNYDPNVWRRGNENPIDKLIEINPTVKRLVERMSLKEVDKKHPRDTMLFLLLEKKSYINTN